jgi:metal-responsive CopG/Arc/MetJ family transcriptional regulator
MTSGTTTGANRADTEGTGKVSISLPIVLLDFVERYRVEHGVASRSQVIERAILVLRERDLEADYRAASAEVDAAWDRAAGDGLHDAAW